MMKAIKDNGGNKGKKGWMREEKGSMRWGRRAMFDEEGKQGWMREEKGSMKE